MLGPIHGVRRTQAQCGPRRSLVRGWERAQRRLRRHMAAIRRRERVRNSHLRTEPASCALPCEGNSGDLASRGLRPAARR